MVICTDANAIKAPVPVSKVIYAYEKQMAYRKSIIEENQLPLLLFVFFPLEKLIINNKMKLPESNRIMVNPAASILSSPKAFLHSTELAAKAIRANEVYKIVLREFFL